MRKTTLILILGFILTGLTFISGGYTIASQGEVSAWYSVILGVVAIVCLEYYQNHRNDNKENHRNDI